MTLAEFTGIVAELCFEHGGSVTSWLRTKQRNAQVGGHPRSRHLTGYGLDVVLDEMTPEKKQVFREEAMKQGVLPIDESDHLHCQPLGPWGRPV